MDKVAWRQLRCELAVAWRYLRSARDDALIHQLSRITVAGLALGVAALILALSVLTGFQEHLLGDVLERSPDLQVEWPHGVPPDWFLEEVASLEGVQGVQRLRQGQGWLRLREPRPVEIVSYERFVPVWMLPSGSSASTASKVGERLAANASEQVVLGGVHVPARFRETWGVEAGDVIEVITPRRTQTPMGRLMPSRRYLPVEGFLSGSRIEEVIRDRVALPLASGRALLGVGSSVVDVALDETADEAKVQRGIEELLTRSMGSLPKESPPPRVVSWQDRHASLLFVLKLEKGAVFMSVALIVLVASFALVSALALILSAKRQELGLLSAVGMSRRRIRRLFLMLGAMLATSGAVVGGVLGATIAWTLDHFRVIPLPGDLYVVDHVPFAVRAPELGAVIVATLVVTMVAAAFGARGATSFTPIEALRR